MCAMSWATCKVKKLNPIYRSFHDKEKKRRKFYIPAGLYKRWSEIKNATQSQSKPSTAASPHTSYLNLQFAIPNQYVPQMLTLQSSSSESSSSTTQTLFVPQVLIHVLFMSEIYFKNTRFSYLLTTLLINILSEMQFSFQVLYKCSFIFPNRIICC